MKSMEGATYVSPQAVGAAKFVKWMTGVGSGREGGRREQEVGGKE